MAKLKIRATELQHTDVRYISLVKRGANRIPFRIIKQEKEDMIHLDLASIFKKEKPAPAPVVLGIVVDSADTSEAVEKAITDAGFSIAEKMDKDGCTVYKQAESLEDAVAVKLSDKVLLLVKSDAFVMDVAKSEDTPAGEFYESIRNQGFYSLIGNSSYLLQDAAYKAFRSCKSAEEASSAVGDIMGAYTNYITRLVGAIPPEVFAMAEDVEMSIMKSEDAPSDEEASTEEGEVNAEASTEEGTEDASEEQSESQEEVAAPESSEGQEDALAAVAKTLADVLDAVSSLKTEMASLSSKVDASKDELEGKLAKVEEVTKSVSNTVTSPAQDDVTLGSTARKKDVDSSEGLIDTAFMPNVRKAAKRFR